MTDGRVSSASRIGRRDKRPLSLNGRNDPGSERGRSERTDSHYEGGSAGGGGSGPRPWVTRPLRWLRSALGSGAARA